MIRSLWLSAALCWFVFSQPAPVEIEGRECVGYLASDAQFFPYTLDLRNTRPGRTQVDVSIYESNGGELLQMVPAVVLDEGKTKRLFINEPMIRYSSINRGTFVRITEGGRTIAEKFINFTVNVSSSSRGYKSRSEIVFGAISRNDQKVIAPFKALPYTQVYELDERFLPDCWVGYESFDAILISDAAFDLMNPLQEQALQDYVISGGIVVIVPPNRPDYFKQGAIQQLHPIVATPVKHGELMIFQFPGAKRDPTYDNPCYFVGKGTIIASETTAQDFATVSAGGIRSLIERISPDDTTRRYPYRSYYRAQETSHTMRNLKEVSLACDACSNYAKVLASNRPGTASVVIVSIIYVGVLVTTVFVLRAKGRMVWNFVGTAVISLFFVIVIVIVGYAFKGWSSVQQGLEITVIRNGADAGVSVDSAFFYLPRGKAYEMSKPGYVPMSYLNHVHTTIRDGTLYTTVSADQWSPSTAPFAGIKRLGGEFRIENSTVYNMTRLKIEHMFIWSGSLVYYGSVDAGEEKNLSAKDPLYFSDDPFANARTLEKLVGDEVTAWMIMGVLSERQSDREFRKYAICVTKSESEFNSTDGIMKLPSRHFLIVDIE